MRAVKFELFAGASVLGVSSPAFAQGSDTLEAATPEVQAAEQAVGDDEGQRDTEELSSIGSGEIVVTARRRNERLQDVPVTVNTVTSEDLQRLNLRNFADITAVVPGLTLAPGGVATVRGVSFNQSASGTSPSLAFYLNDAPVPSTDLFTAMFDIGQIEVLRGPQGTLRGKAAPSGALTMTTRRPSLDRVGGYVSMTGTHRGGINANAAVGAPLIADILAVRVAALVDHGPGNLVESINTGLDQRNKQEAVRGTVLFEPTESLQFVLTAQKYWNDNRSYLQVESISPQPGFTFIEARDRLAVQDSPQEANTTNENYNLQGRFAFAGQVLSYVGQRTIEDVETIERFDTTDIYGPSFPAVFQGIAQFTPREVKTWSHELRLSSEDRLFGMLDYTIGAFYNKINAPTRLYTPQSVTLATRLIRADSNLRLKRDEETSFFGNLTLHLSDQTELSGGVRHIDYKTDAGLCGFGARTDLTEVFEGPFTPPNEDCTLNPAFEFHEKFKSWIYTASAKHKFSDDLMMFATTGSSWRPGVFPGGFVADTLSDRQREFLILPPEKSKSYEVGFKSSFLDRRMRLNASAFYQKFNNFPFRPSSATTFVTPGASNSQTRSGFVAALPVKVHGGEVEWAFAPTRNWDLGVNVAYAKSKVSGGGVVPCTDYFAPFGVADTAEQTSALAGLTAAQRVAQINAATLVNGVPQGIGACQLNGSVSLAPKWSANAQTEYRVPVSDASDGFVRGLVSWYGKNDPNDPLNPIDQVKSYALLNLYAGLRDSSGDWEVSFFAKNVTNTFRVLSRDSSRFQPQFGAVLPAGVTAPVAPEYRRVINMTPPREFGLNVRYAFGSR